MKEKSYFIFLYFITHFNKFLIIKYSKYIVNFIVYNVCCMYIIMFLYITGAFLYCLLLYTRKHKKKEYDRLEKNKINNERKGKI